MKTITTTLPAAQVVELLAHVEDRKLDAADILQRMPAGSDLSNLAVTPTREAFRSG